MHLHSEQRNLLAWQMLVGFLTLFPTGGFVIFGVSMAIGYDWWAMDPVFLALAGLWLLAVIAGLLQLVFDVTLLTHEQVSLRAMTRAAWSSIVINLTFAALFLGTAAMAYPGPDPRSTYTLIALGGLSAYPLFIAWLWWKLFLLEPSRKPLRPTSS